MSKKVTTKIDKIGKVDIDLEDSRPTHSEAPGNLDKPNVRIVVAVAKTLQFYTSQGKQEYIMEPGRQAAQACHAISALKLRYCEEHSLGSDKELRRLVGNLTVIPITTIVLQARDTKEILQLGDLAERDGLFHCIFHDDNEAVYKTKATIPTAIAIGPIPNYKLITVSDYLPLWKDGI